jgi:ferric-dicitrate binding protein FerR (iron transport regulator)
MSPSGGGGALAPGEDYNTLFNPRGSKVISLTLSDGTKVWLNAESSLRYPASFSAPSAVREVEITGEAYFEVKHNSKQPFKVHLPNGSIVEDFGTAFNINAYPDEEATKTTLIEGSIKVSAPSADKNLRNQREKILKPGEQARLTANSQWLTTNPDLGEVMAWKNGRFQFNRTPLPVVLRQLSRWYDIDVEYHGNVPDVVFAGRMGRDLNLSQVLIVLNKMEVNFKIEGKKLIVMP